MISITQFFQILLGFAAWVAIATVAATIITIFLGVLFSAIEYAAELIERIFKR